MNGKSLNLIQIFDRPNDDDDENEENLLVENTKYATSRFYTVFNLRSLERSLVDINFDWFSESLAGKYIERANYCEIDDNSKRSSICINYPEGRKFCL